MNVFEDLVVELKEENLLENTVIEGLSLDVNFGEPEFGRESEFLRKEAERRAETPANGEIDDEDLALRVSVPQRPVAEVKRSSKKAADTTSYQKKLSDAAAAYQMVEHILTAIERLNTGSTNAGFDDLRVNKALHRLSQASADPASAEYAEAETAASDEIGAWVKGLTKRDAAITVAQLRQYCETCQPALSSQALFSLACFYYELPTTSEIRAKFDFILTKLFSRPSDDGGRQMICPRRDVIDHLGSRFGEWKRTPSGAVTEPETLLDSLSFDDFINEVESAVSLDELNSSGFFARVRALKENAGDNFFTPSVAASVIECNVAIGNKLVSLLQAESKKLGAEQVKERYGFLERDSFETAANRTFDLEEVLRVAAIKRESRRREPVIIPAAVDVKEPVDQKAETGSTQPNEHLPRTGFASFAVNKWLLIVGGIAIALSIGLYVWADRMTDEVPVSNRVKVVDMEGSSFKEFIKDGRVSTETFYGVTTNAWDRLKEDEKRELLAKLVQAGAQSGYKRVSLINARGKTVAFASADRVQLTEPK